MKTMIQLNADRTKVHWRWQWDEVHPLAQMFTPEIVDLMMDVSNYNPQPEEGWATDGQNFFPPAGPTQAELLVRLEAAKQSYIDQHYPLPTREGLIVYCLSPTATNAGKALAVSAWNWIDGEVLNYFYTKQAEIEAGQNPEIDFTQFDAGDPAVTLKAVLEAT